MKHIQTLPYLLIGAAPLWLNAGINTTNVKQQVQKTKAGKWSSQKPNCQGQLKCEEVNNQW